MISFFLLPFNDSSACSQGMYGTMSTRIRYFTLRHCIILEEKRNIKGIILSNNEFTILLISRSFENFFENCSNNSLRSRNEFSALDLSKGSFVSANLIQSSRRKKRFSGHKPRSRLSSSRLNYDHGHYSGQTRLSVSTRPSPLAAIPDYSRETASIRGVSVISVTSDRDTFYPGRESKDSKG